MNGLLSKTDFNLKGVELGLVLKESKRELGNGLFTIPSCSLFCKPVAMSSSSHVICRAYNIHIGLVSLLI